eukprot:GGOE01053892.1.p1 GENE.GGOE01053892.1~~GGOE01053892.1.p1  ORF type:complete len:404 (+),score=103.42 GGOE01053892.1:143-1213(+)
MTSLRPPIREKKTTKKLSFAEKRLLRKRKREERRTMRKVLKKKLKRPVFILPKMDEGLEVEDEEGKNAPPIHSHINGRTKCLDIKVDLHHCPPQYINLNPTATHFVLDTLKWSKKYQVNQRFLGDVTCDPSKATAQFEHSVLRVSLPITDMPKETRDKQARVSAAIREAKRLRFVQARGGEVVGMRVVPAKERKRKRDEDDEGSDSHVPIPRVGPKKKFVTDKQTLEILAADAAATEEDKVAGRQAKMGVTEAYFKEKHAQKMEAKDRKADITDRVLDRIVAQQQKHIRDKEVSLGLQERPPLASGVDSKTKGRSDKKRVSFATTNMVVKFGTEGSCTGKKAKGKKVKEHVVEYHS